MKKVFFITAVSLTLLFLLIAGCTSPLGGKAVPPASPTVTPTLPSTCGFTTCHGLNLACGPNPPQFCTMEYQIGDKCRQYAGCDGSGGSCRLITTPQYDACKSCVAKCGGGDAAEILGCEVKC